MVNNTRVRVAKANGATGAATGGWREVTVRADTTKGGAYWKILGGISAPLYKDSLAENFVVSYK